MLVALIKEIGYTKGLPVVVDPKVMSAKKFIDAGINDKGEVFKLSPDPELDTLAALFKGFKLGQTFNREILHHFFSNDIIFVIDLYAYNLGEKVENMFDEMSFTKGAIQNTIEKYVK